MYKTLFEAMIEQQIAQAQQQMMAQAVKSVAPGAPDYLVNAAVNASGKGQSDMVSALFLGSLFGLF